MPAHPSWKGFLKLSLVSFPVKAYTAVGEGDKIHFNQLHEECGSRIQYKKFCPIHGEVPKEEIVSGFEYAKGQYVIVDPEELDKLRTEDEKAITITTFVEPDTIDPVYFSGRTYYLLPDGPVGEKPYATFLQAMTEEKRHAIAQVVMHGREQVLLLRPMDNLLTMTVLDYENQVTKPQAFEDYAPDVEPSKEELDMTRTLIKAKTAKRFDFANYKDVYTEKLSKVIEAKVAGQEIVAPPPAQEQPHIINLMDALRASVASAEKEQPSAATPPKKMAGSKGKEPRARKKKSS